MSVIDPRYPWVTEGEMSFIRGAHATDCHCPLCSGFRWFLRRAWAGPAGFRDRWRRWGCPAHKGGHTCDCRDKFIAAWSKQAARRL